MNREIKLKEVFKNIIDICEKNIDTESTLKDIAIKAKNRVIRYEWEEKYGVKLDSMAKLAENDCYRIDGYQFISFFEDGYKCKEGCYGRSISWSEDNKQPVNEWIYNVSFSTGAYIFGEDYEGQKQLFQEFFEELRTYKPDYEDLHNHNLYWKIENAKSIMENFNNILEKYYELNKQQLKQRKIDKLKAELENLTN